MGWDLGARSYRPPLFGRKFLWLGLNFENQGPCCKFITKLSKKRCVIGFVEGFEYGGSNAYDDRFDSGRRAVSARRLLPPQYYYRDATAVTSTEVELIVQCAPAGAKA